MTPSDSFSGALKNGFTDERPVFFLKGAPRGIVIFKKSPYCKYRSIMPEGGGKSIKFLKAHDEGS
jgi:hypothetical protein